MRLLTLLLVLAASPLLSQTYAPLGAEWKYDLISNFNNQIRYSTYQSDSIFTFDNRNCSRIVYRLNPAFGFPCPPDIDTGYVASNADSIFIYEGGRWQLLAAFNASNLDSTTIQVYNSGGPQTIITDIKIQFDSARTALINGQTLRQVYLREIGGQSYYQFHDGWFTETIGHEFAPIPWTIANCAFGSYYDYGLRCYSDSAFGAVNFRNYGCDSIVTQLEEYAAGETQLRIYPNPAIDQFTIEFSDTKPKNILLRDQSGRIILEKNHWTATLCRFRTEELDSGIYFLEVKSGDNSRLKKVLVL